MGVQRCGDHPTTACTSCWSDPPATAPFDLKKPTARLPQRLGCTRGAAHHNHRPGHSAPAHPAARRLQPHACGRLGVCAIVGCSGPLRRYTISAKGPQGNLCPAAAAVVVEGGRRQWELTAFRRLGADCTQQHAVCAWGVCIMRSGRVGAWLLWALWEASLGGCKPSMRQPIQCGWVLYSSWCVAPGVCRAWCMTTSNPWLYRRCAPGGKLGGRRSCCAWFTSCGEPPQACVVLQAVAEGAACPLAQAGGQSGAPPTGGRQQQPACKHA